MDKNESYKNSKCSNWLILASTSLLLLGSQAMLAAPLSLEEVYALYPRETLQAAFSKHYIKGSTAENPEDVPLYARYGFVFSQLISNYDYLKDRFSEDDWAKIMVLPAHHHERFVMPQYFLMLNDCQVIEEISQSNRPTRAVEIGQILMDQTWTDIERLDQHYINFITTLSVDGQAQLDQEYQRIIVGNKGSIGWSIRDHVGLAGDVPDFVEQNALRFCQSISSMEAESWISQDLLADNGNDDTPEIPMKTIYAPLPINPLFDSDGLHIPVVLTNDREAVYQYAVLKPVEGDLWQLQSVIETSALPNIRGKGMSRFGDIATGGHHALVNVSGSFSSGCEWLGGSAIRFDESSHTFHVELFNSVTELSSDETACTAQVSDYRVYQPLPIYGLPAGDYRVVVNGEPAPGVQLEQANVYSDLASSTVVHASHSNALLAEDTLHVPFIDTPVRGGRYQDVELTEVDQNLWRVTSIKEGKMLDQIAEADLVEMGDDVKQILLNVKGSYSDNCRRPGKVVSRFKSESNTLEVNFYEYLPSDSEMDEGICTTGNETFDFVYPLPVYAAPAGEYHVLVNGEHNLTFSLEKQNVSSVIFRPFGSL